MGHHHPTPNFRACHGRLRVWFIYFYDDYNYIACCGVCLLSSLFYGLSSLMLGLYSLSLVGTGDIFFVVGKVTFSVLGLLFSLSHLLFGLSSWL